MRTDPSALGIRGRVLTPLVRMCDIRNIWSQQTSAGRHEASGLGRQGEVTIRVSSLGCFLCRPGLGRRGVGSLEEGMFDGCS